MSKVSRSYQDELLHALTNPVEAAAYLNAALDEGSIELFILALQNVAQAQALKAGLHASNEQIAIDVSTLPELFEQAGLRFAVQTTV